MGWFALLGERKPPRRHPRPNGHPMAGQRPYGGSEAVASEARGWERGIRCFGDHKPPDNTQELGEHPMSPSIPYERVLCARV